MSTGYLQFTQLTYQVKEDGTWLTTKPLVERIGGVDEQVSVRVGFSNNKTNQATKDVDFIMPTQLLIWNDGESGNKEVNLSILQDTIKENDEVFKLSLSKIAVASYGERKKANVIISDDDSLINPNSNPNPNPNPAKTNITLSNEYPTTIPNKEGDIWIVNFPAPEQKEFVYLGVITNNNLSWKKISNNGVFSSNNPQDNVYDFKGQIWMNTTNNNVWIRGNNSWISLTNNSNNGNVDLSDINLRINTIQNQLILTNNIANEANGKIEILEQQIDLELIDEREDLYLMPGFSLIQHFQTIRSNQISYDKPNGKFVYEKTGLYEVTINLAYEMLGLQTELGKIGFRMSNHLGDTCGRSHLATIQKGFNHSSFKFLFATTELSKEIYLYLVCDKQVRLKYSNNFMNMNFPGCQISIRKIAEQVDNQYPIYSF